nr:hypothetical protein [Tanacetum cinerariifolium]
MDSKKHIVNLEYFKEILHICPRLPGQTFNEPPFEEEILDFLRFLGHSGAIRRLTDVNINKLHQPWRSFAAISNKFLSGKSSGYDSLRLNIKIQRRVTRYIILVATGVTPPKTKASVRKTKSSFDTTVNPPPTTAAGTRLFTSAKGKQPATTSKAKNEGTGTIPEVPDVPTEESDEEISWKSSDADDDDAQDDDDDDDQDDENKDDDDRMKIRVHDEEETRDEESFDPIPKTPENIDEDGNDKENLGLNVGREEGQDEEDDKDELYKDSSSVSSQFMTSNPTPDAEIESIFETTSQMDVQAPTSVAPLPLSPPTLTPSTIATITTVQQAPTPPTIALSTLLKDLPNFGSLFGFNHRLKTLEANFSEFMQTTQFAGAVSSILGIVQRYIDQRMNEAVKIIKEQVKEQVKVQVFKILPKIEQTVNEQLKVEVLTRSSNSSNTLYAVDADLSNMELKKILIKKMEGNKSIHRSNDQRNLYKALVEAYEYDKIILDTYKDTVTLKRRCDDDADKDEEPSAGLDQGSKRQREGKEPESASSPRRKLPGALASLHKGLNLDKHLQASADDQPIAEPSQHPKWFSQQKKPPTPDPFLMNQIKVDTLTLKLLVGPTYELIKGSCKSLVEREFFLEEVYKAMTDQLDWVNPVGHQYQHNLLNPLPLIPNSQGHCVIPFDHFINNDLEYLRGGASSHKYTTSVTKTKAADYGHIKWIEDLVPRTIFAVNKESARDVYSKRRIIAVTELKIVEWYNYKHLDWITVRRDDEKLYKFKEGDFKRLHIQDIEDMLLLLVQGKLTKLTVEERFAFNKKLNLTRLDTYRSDLKRKEAYIAYSNPRGFIYQNKDKQNRLMQIDELHKFSDGTLTDVRTALDDRLKGIRMKYLPQTIWRKSDKERPAAMI